MGPERAEETAGRILPLEEVARFHAEATRKVGVLLGTPGPGSSAEETTVRASARQSVVDGPFAETKEQLG